MTDLAALVNALAWFILAFAATILGVFIVWHGHATHIKILAVLLLALYFGLVLMEPPQAVTLYLMGGPARWAPALRNMTLAMFFCLAAREVMLWLKR